MGDTDKIWAEAYSPARALQLARCCHLVMQDQAVVSRRLAEMGGEMRYWFENRNGTQGAMLAFPWGNVLVFRATEIRLDRPWESMKDVLTDLLFRPVPFRGAMVHHGFLRAYQSIDADVVNAVDAVNGGKALFITGHSLGGGIAKLAGMVIDGRKVGAVYTYGAPRLGNGMVDRAIGAPLYQFIHAADIVPRVPPVSFSYRAAGDRRFIARDWTISRGTGLKSASTFLWTLLTRPTRLVKDHDMGGCYLAAIRKAAEGR
jgi:hypothetical protein